MPISKKFFRLRRVVGNPPGVLPKHRKTGYYYIHWSYGNHEKLGGVWRIGYYMAECDKWALTGDSRPFKDADFIAIDEHQVRGPWSKGAAVVYNIVLVILGWNLMYIIIETYKLLKQIIK